MKNIKILKYSIVWIAYDVILYCTFEHDKQNNLFNSVFIYILYYIIWYKNHEFSLISTRRFHIMSSLIQITFVFF